MRNTTVSELGQSLPIGKEAPGGERLRDFAFKPWRTTEEKAIGKWRDENPSASHGQFVAYVLSYFLTRWCGESFEDVPIDKRRLAMSTSYACDVLYAWIALRRFAMEDNLDMELSCGRCRNVVPYTISLGTIDTKIPDDDDPLTEAFQVRDGLVWQGKDSRILTLKPVQWWVYETGSGNMGDLKANVIAGSIAGLDKVEGEVRIPGEVLDLSKYDLEALTAKINDWEPGPDLSVEVNCPKCDFRIIQSIPWMFDHFFSLTASSLSEVRT